jgi:hypothetical protein
MRTHDSNTLYLNNYWQLLSGSAERPFFWAEAVQWFANAPKG